MRRATLALILLAAACGAPPAGINIEQVDVSVTVQDDGSALVREKFVVNLGTEPVGEFRWRAPVWRHDGVTDVVASADGAPYRVGTGIGHAAIGNGPGLDVRWEFPATTDVHEFGLSYRAKNVVHVSGIRGIVSWRAIPSTIPVRIGSVNITMTLPDSAVLLDDPWVDEAGWSVTRQAHGMSATRPLVSPGVTATAGLEFTIDHMHAPLSQWQTVSDRLDEYIPAFIAAAIFILVVAVGVMWMLWLKHPPQRVVADGTPRKLGRASVIWRARRQKGNGVVDDLVGLGLIDAERVEAARDLWRAGIAVIVFGALAWPVTTWIVGQYGAWPLVVPWSIVVAGVVFLVGAARFPVLTEAGAKARVLYCARISDGRTKE